MMLRRLSILAALCLMGVAAFAAREGGSIPVPLPLFPADNWWNTDISNAPVDPGSAGYINFIGASRGLHPDFGGDAGGGDVYGFPYIIVDGSQPKLPVKFDDADESDNVGYPIPNEAVVSFGWIEGGQPGAVDQRMEGDRHMLIIDQTHNDLYELYNVWYDGSKWLAGSGSFFDMNTNNRRPEGWTSADAAGLAILPGLVRYDEVFGSNEINHAFRVTVRATNGHVFPASHTAGDRSGALPMGARLRLKSSTNISNFPTEVQRIYRAFKKYGLIVADNGSDMYVSGTYDTRWNNDVLNPAFDALHAGDFEVVQLGWQPSLSLQLSFPSAVRKGTAATLVVMSGDQNYRGTVRITSSDASASLPANYTFTSADKGMHSFNVVLNTPGNQSITATDTANSGVTATRNVTVTSNIRRRAVR